ncbi:hypothetical protein BDZ91DRAFT_768644 [Kalaharituber pfeilii]|nr:hypothetical protein BDZ91DRAFT_768644 [Kalaharituber pfeilii]
MAPLTKFEVTELLSVTSENLSVSKRMDMRLQRIEDRLAPENVTALETHQREVLGMSLDESLLRLKDDYLTEHEMEEFQYSLYVPVEATEQPYADERVDLLQCVQDFIRGTKQICLIQGSAGSGKSTFNHYLARHLWSEYERASKQTEAAIPLFISLTSIVSSKPDSEDLIASYFSDRDFTEQDINLARRTRRFVFMLDGYDEIERRDCNFYAKNKLSRWKAKIIITSRPEYLGSGYHSKFHPPNRRDLLQEYWLAPFSTDTIKSYISGFLQAKPTGRPAIDYEAYLTQPEIRDMISNPFLLRMIMTVEPSMDHEFLINRVDLYKRFFGHCLAKAQSRLDNIQLTSDQRRIFQRLCDETFSDHAEQFCRDFAMELYRHKAVEVTYRPGTARGSSAGEGDSKWQNFLGNDDERTRLLRFSAPLTRHGQSYRFLHKSLRDYLIAQSLWEDPLLAQCAAKALLNEFFIVEDPGVLDFVVEQATLEHELQQKLLQYVEKSKTDDLVVQGAANALTVLVKSGMRFSGYDLRGIQVPRADLRFGWFDGAQLQGSDLRHLRLQGAWLRGANLSESKMAGVWFGERPAIGGSIVSSWETMACYSPDGRLAVRAFAKDFRSGIVQLSLWSIVEEKLMKKTVLDFHMDFSKMGGMAISPNPDVALLVVWQSDKLVLLSLPELEVVHRYSAVNGDVICEIGFSPDGKLLAMARGVHSPYDTLLGDYSDTRLGNLDCNTRPSWRKSRRGTLAQSCPRTLL